MTIYIRDIQLAQKGDTAAFSRLYGEVYKELYRTAYFSLRCSVHDAEDVVSETALEAFETIHKLRKPEAFRSWIFTILSRKIKKKQKAFYSQEVEEHIPTEDFSYASSELKQIIASLSDTDRSILCLTVLGGYTSDEVGVMFGMKPSAIRSRLTRMKAQLRAELME